jgi:outer membrane beta-barrel protein
VAPPRTDVVLRAAALALLLGPSGAQGGEAADDGHRSELVERAAVADRLYQVAGRFELGVRGGLDLLPELTEAYPVGLAAAYNVAEWWAVELRLGHAFAGNTSAAAAAAARLYGLDAPVVTELKDTWRLGPHVVAGVRLQPIYGKVNLAAELPVHFQLYGWVGGGAVLLDRTSPSLCLAPRSAGVDPQRCVQGGVVHWEAYLTETRASPLVSLALGLRLFLAQHHLLSVEVRSWSYLDRSYQGVVRAAVSAANPAGGGTAAPEVGLTHVGTLELGYAYVF